MTLRRIARGARGLAAAALGAASLSFPVAAAQAAGPPPVTVPGEVVVGFTPGSSAAARADARQAADGALVQKLADPSVQVLDVDGSVSGAVAELRRRGSVRFAEPNYIGRPAAAVTPDDPGYTQQWGFDKIGMPASWGYATGSAAVKVAVLDTGVDLDHPDLQARLDVPDGHDYVDDDAAPDDPSGHGTHVAGTIGAIGNNGTGVAGINWTTTIVPLRVCGVDPVSHVDGCKSSDQADALLRAGQAGVRVANMSIVGPASAAVDAALAAYPQMLVVAAAGNTTQDVDTTPVYPCASPRPNVICVAASGTDDALAAFSSYGAARVDLAAPGVNVWSTRPGPTLYGNASGTSAAAPFVAGVAALALGANPSATSSRLRDALEDSVDTVPALSGKVATGGRLDAFATLADLDHTGPATTFTTGPPAATRFGTVHLVFGADEDPATFECRLDAGAWTACTSPRDVTTGAQGDHVLAVRATDGLGNLGEPAEREWTLDTASPSVSIGGGPSGTVDRRTATFTFGASEPATFTCALDGGAREPCTSPATFSGLADGPHSLEVRGSDAAGNVGADTAAWTVDAAPTTTITSGPGPLVGTTTAQFTFGATGATSFECAADGGAWDRCTSPLTLAGFAPGEHTLRVRARDGVHAPNEVSAWTWMVDTTPPALSILSAPQGGVASRSAAITFFAGDATATECSLDGGAFAACTSPWSIDGLGDGDHVAVVRARDNVGNTGTAMRAWSVDATGPAVAITSGPAAGAVSLDGTARFDFAADDAGALLSCSLDGAPFTACASPATYTGLAEGVHTFAVRATDALGNARAATRTFTVAIPQVPPGTAQPPADAAADFAAAVAQAVGSRISARTPAAAARTLRALKLQAKSPQAGVLRVTVALRGRHTVTLASAAKSFSRATTATLRLRAVHDATARLRGKPSAKLRVTASFTPATGARATARRTVTLKRAR